MSIAEELQKLLNLKNDLDLQSVAHSTRLHFSEKYISISFKNTNKYHIAELTLQRVVVPTIGAQQCPDLATMLIRLVNTALLNKTGYPYLNLNQMINADEINHIFLSRLLSTLRGL